ncbi:MAG: hypothetical protein P8170_07485 [Gemmatimonadota bacterium]
MNRLHPLAGHVEARRALFRAHTSAGLPASLLIHGIRGIGKRRLALWMAQLQVCEAPGSDGPCGDCRPCRMALGLEHPDIHLYFPVTRPRGVSGDRLMDALESVRIDALDDLRTHPLRPSSSDESRGLYLGTVRNIRRRCHAPPNMAPVQVFIVADAEYLVPQEASQEAANALLKLLEEPPPATRFILTSSEPGRLLPTIRSRSVPLHLARMEADEVSAFLQHHRQVDPEVAARAARLGQGSIGRALGFLPDEGEPGPFEARRRDGFELVKAALSRHRSDGYAVALGLPPAGARKLVELFAHVEDWLRDLAAVAAGAEERVVSQDALSQLRALARDSGVTPAGLAAGLPAVEEARELARGNVNPQLVVSGLMSRLRQTVLPATPRASAP